MFTATMKEGFSVMRQLERIRQMKNEIQDIAQRHNAERIFVFGSCARGEETPESDIDFLADFNEDASLFDHAGLEIDLEDMLGCKVDVVSLGRLSKDDAFSRMVKKEMIALC